MRNIEKRNSGFGRRELHLVLCSVTTASHYSTAVTGASEQAGLMILNPDLLALLGGGCHPCPNLMSKETKAEYNEF